MKLTREDLKKIFQSSVLRKSISNRHDCPSPNEFFIILSEQVPRSKKLDLVDHIANCPLCLEEFALILQLQTGQDTLSNYLYSTKSNQTKSVKNFLLDVGKKVLLIAKTSKIFSFTRQYLLLLAVLCIILGGSLFLYFKREVIETQRSKTYHFSLLHPTNRISRNSEIIFKWSGFSEADHYLVVLFDEALNIVWESKKIYHTFCKLPNNIHVSLLPQKPYFWIVTAVNNDKSKIESELMSFRFK